MGNPTTVELKLNAISLTRNRRQRDLYFVLAVSDASDNQHIAVTHLPSEGVLTLGKHQTSYSFIPEGDPGGGLFLLALPMPGNQTLSVRLWLMEARNQRKDLGKLLTGISDFVESNVEKNGLLQAIGGLNPLLITGFKTANEGLSQVGEVLAQSGDKQVGFVSLDQSFNAVTLPLICTQNLMSGQGQISWTWAYQPTLAN